MQTRHSRMLFSPISFNDEHDERGETFDDTYGNNIFNLFDFHDNENGCR